MKIVRYRLTSGERHAVEVLAVRAGQIRADADIKASESTIRLTPGSRKGEVGYFFDVDRFPEECSELRTVTETLKQLGNPSKRSTIVILENVPIDERAAATVLIFGSLFGQVRQFRGHGAPIVEVSNHDTAHGSRPSSGNNVEFDLHTDMSFYDRPPRFVAFLMVNPAVIGGQSTFCDPRPILDRLSKEAMSELRRSFLFPAPPHMPELGAQKFPIVDIGRTGGWSVRYRRDGLIATDSKQAEALRIWDRDIASFEVEMPLEQGELAFFSNACLLHGRRAFGDPIGTPERLALRAYVDV